MAARRRVDDIKIPAASKTADVLLSCITVIQVYSIDG